MNFDQKRRLAKINNEIAKLDSELTRNSASTPYLSERDGNDEVVISGNTAGLIHFANRILTLCLRDTVGAHEHFDTNGMLDECDRAIVVTAVKAEWDT